MPNANDYLLTGDQFSPAVRNGKVTPLIDSHNYFPALATALAGANGSSDFIYIMGWSLHWLEKDVSRVGVDAGIPHGFRLFRSHAELPTEVPEYFLNDFIDIVKDKSKAGVDVRVMGWISDGSAGISRANTLAHGIGQNAATINAIRELRKEPTLSHKCCLNTLAHLVGAVHSKLVLIGTADRTVAFTGGIDLAHGRHGMPPHGINDSTRLDYNAWHDVQAQIEGPAVQDIYDYFKDVWKELLENKAVQLRVQRSTGGSTDGLYDLEEFFNYAPDTPPISEKTVSTQAIGDPYPIQSLRTLPQANYHFLSPMRKFPIGFAESGKFEVQAAWEKAILTATTYIYIEDQFLYSEDLYRWIGEALRNKPGLRVLLVKGLPDPNDPDIFWPLVKTAIRVGLKDLSQEQLNRIGFFVHKRAVVHSKTTLIDDVWAMIGSANFAQRSLYTDFEHCISFAHEPTVRKYRKTLWDEHLKQNGGSSTVVDDDISVSLSLWDSLQTNSFEKLSLSHENSGPNLQVPGPLKYPPSGLIQNWIDPDSRKEWNPCPL